MTRKHGPCPPCNGAHDGTGAPCHLWELYERSPAHRAHWDGTREPDPPPPVPPPPRACAHLGRRVRDERGQVRQVACPLE